MDFSIHSDIQYDFNAEAVKMESRTQKEGLIGMKRSM